MIAVAIIAIILLLIVSLLLCPIKLSVVSDGKLTVKAGVGLIMLDILKKKRKKLKLRDFSQKKYLAKIEALKKTKQKTTVKKEEPEKGEKTPLSETVDFILEILRKVDTYTGRLKTRIKRLELTVGGTDPAFTAIAYGVASQATAYLVETLDTKTKLIRKESDVVTVNCDYCSAEYKLSADIELSIKVIDGIRTAIEILMLKAKHEANTTNTRKVGQENV